ncbi:amino acid ABC transporter permease [Psychromarinibacter sp. C21-152]|uniref:Amino acid ABC transporter permease n=1 Tax=Psychromarinibacter sediminicola TaxID=3033385 RepID=A0AAE3NWC2_9RHOB|nr:amino acid ABC transporter permease [Psychromarinibacter sediminicola]MDF0603311.1 amino acid ABC transporter permease [Psychromarinibacter sediminicola]
MNYDFRFSSLLAYRDELVEGVLLTLQLSAATIVIGLVIGVVVAAMRTGAPGPFKAIATVYVETIRNTPLLVQLFIIFFGLPSLGLRFTANEAALLGLSVNLGAYSAEIIRAGIESVRKSQIEAGHALGMNGYQVFRYVILFQALKSIYPALTSQFILLMLMSSIVSTIGANELFHQASFIDSRTFRSFEVYSAITLIYLCLTLVFRSVFLGIYWSVFVRRPAR